MAKANSLKDINFRDKVRNAYVRGIEVDGDVKWLSIPKTAEHFGIHRSVFYEVAERDGWDKQRDVHRAKIREEGDKLVREQMADAAAKFNLDGFETAQSMMAACKNRFKESEIGDNGDSGEKNLKSIEARNIASVYDNAMRNGKLALGEHTSSELILQQATVYTNEEFGEIVRGRKRPQSSAVNSTEDDNGLGREKSPIPETAGADS